MSESKNFSEKLHDKILDLLGHTIEERKTEYAENKITDIPKDVEDIYKKVANINGIISGTAGLVPGPFGMALALPEITLITRNQINMVYDIGRSLGKEKQISKELILGIILSSAGATSIGILTVQGSKVVVKGTSLVVLKRIVAILGGRILKAEATSMLAKWVPIAGAAAMAAWSRYATMVIGKYAVSVFNKNIEVSNEQYEEANVIEENSTTNNVQLERLQVLNNLLHIDRVINENEISLLKDLITKADISSKDKESLKTDLSNGKVYDIDYSIIKNSNTDATGLLMDMIALIQIDNNFHFSEKIYLKKVAEEIGIGKEEIEELLFELK